MAYKKSAISGEYMVGVRESGSIEVYRVYDNVKGALREIAEKEGFEYDPNWTTRQFGTKLIDFLNEDGAVGSGKEDIADSTDDVEESKPTRLVELSNQIKTLLEGLGKDHLVLRVANTNKDFDIDEIDEDVLEELRDACNENSSFDVESRLVGYDCGGWFRALQLDGVVIEDDTMKFYLTEVEISDNGDDDVQTWKTDLDGMLDDRAWWMAGGNSAVEFDPERVLNFYVDILTKEDYSSILVIAEKI